MLSNRDVPRPLLANLEWRARLNHLCSKKSGRYRAAVMHACAADPLFWINSFVFQYNPMIRGREAGPFILWGSQDRALAGEPGIFWAMDQGRDITVQKSREEGGSYLTLLAFLHRFLFVMRQKFLCISRNEETVENPGDHDALFTKVEYVLGQTPKWMRGGWAVDNKAHRRKRFFYCPATRGVITGQATTTKAAIGGRYSAVMLDEFAHIEMGAEIRRRTAATTRCRIFVSTHAGAGTEFNRLCNQADVPKVVLHWTDHPHKRAGLYRFDTETQRIEVLDKGYEFPPEFTFVTSGEPTGGHMPGVRSPHYDRECNRIGSVAAVAEELDINPSGSVKQVFDPVLIGQLALRAQAPWWRGDLAFDPDTGFPSGLVRQPGGRLKLWLNPTREGKVPLADYAGGVDVSAGVGATPSSLAIGDVARRQKVLELCRSDLDPREFAAIVAALCRLFAAADGSAAFLCYESTGAVGGAFGKRLTELRFGRFWTRPTSSKFLSTSGEVRGGWMSTGPDKNRLLLDYHLALKRGEFYNPSESALRECLNFKLNARGFAEYPDEVPAPEGSESKYVHGDVVIADALLCKMFAHLAGPLAKFTPGEVTDQDTPASLGWRRRMAEAEQLAEVD